MEIILQIAKLALALTVLTACSLPDSALPGQSPSGGDWSYGGAGAPNHWGSLSQELALCTTGDRQSPIDLSGYIEARSAPALIFNYSQNALEIKHNGKIAHVEYGEGNTLTVGDETYHLVAVHIHAHAEHQIDQQLFAAEMHLVHRRKDGSLGVVGQIFRLEDADPVVQALLDSYPESGQTRYKGFTLNARDFLPASLGYYHYEGSLTTPPCSEEVDWYVLREIKTVSQEQVNAIADLHNGFNHRPIQARNGREIVLAGP